jgi:hypothetical protein
MFTYVILNNLPKIPDHFLTKVAEIQKSMTGNFTPERRANLDNFVYKPVNTVVMNPKYRGRVMDIDGKQIPTTYSSRISMGEDFNHWIKDNIYPPGIVPEEVGIAFIPGQQIDGGSSHQGAHVDSTRNYALIYLLDPGGDNVITTWYKEEGQPTYRPRKTDLDQLTVNDYTRLIEIDSVCLPTNCWVLFNARTLHDVANIETLRVSFHIGFDKNIWFDDRMIPEDYGVMSPYAR